MRPLCTGWSSAGVAVGDGEGVWLAEMAPLSLVVVVTLGVLVGDGLAAAMLSVDC